MNIVEKQTMDRGIQIKGINLGTGLLRTALIIIALLGALGAGLVAFIWFSGGSGQPSAALTAPGLSLSPTGKLFHLTQDSRVRFIIDEMLMGQPNKVVGSTNQIAGEIMVDFTHPENIQLGTVRINVKTLTTDNEFRNRALRGQILHSTTPEFEFATFVPGKITGFPSSITLGQAITFRLVGNLTVNGVTREVTFDTVVTPISQDRLEGKATATVNYKDFGISIPDVPGVANVGEGVLLELDFVALPGNS